MRLKLKFNPLAFATTLIGTTILTGVTGPLTLGRILLINLALILVTMEWA